MIEDLKKRLEGLAARHLPGDENEIAELRRRIDEVDELPLVMQLAYLEPIIDRLDEISQHG